MNQIERGDIHEIAKRTGISAPTVKDRLINGPKKDVKYIQVMDCLKLIIQERETAQLKSLEAMKVAASKHF